MDWPAIRQIEHEDCWLRTRQRRHYCGALDGFDPPCVEYMLKLELLLSLRIARCCFLLVVIFIIFAAAAVVNSGTHK